MSNRIQIRHGSETPTTDNLVSYELGYVHNGALYINDNGVIAQLTQPDLIGLVNQDKKIKIPSIDATSLNYDKILVCNNDNIIYYKTANNIREEIGAFAAAGGVITGSTEIDNNLTVNKNSNFCNNLIIKEKAIIIGQNNYGTIDPNQAGQNNSALEGEIGQLYFVLTE